MSPSSDIAMSGFAHNSIFVFCFFQKCNDVQPGSLPFWSWALCLLAQPPSITDISMMWLQRLPTAGGPAVTAAAKRVLSGVERDVRGGNGDTKSNAKRATAPRTVKGMKDLLPEQFKRRRQVLSAGACPMRLLSLSPVHPMRRLSLSPVQTCLSQHTVFAGGVLLH
jgi:hypothetical protein